MNLTYFFIDFGLIALTVAALVAGVYWTGVLFQSIRTTRTVITARQALGLPDPSGPDPWPSVCIVIPAHNEAHGIGELARTLVAQDYPRLSVVFALDRCTDDTEAVLRAIVGGDERFTIHVVNAWNDGWAGKVNAVWQGVQSSEACKAADLLLFADADTLFEPRCVRACVKLLLHRNAGMLSLFSTLTRRTWFERLIQPAAGFELIRQFPPLKVNRSVHSRSLANGQFMLIRREVYEALGGHAALRHAILEDLLLAALVKHQGVMSEVTFADGMLFCRMYESWPAFTSGWRRIFAELANRKPRRLKKAAALNLMFGCVLPLAALVVLVLGLVRSHGEGVIQDIAPTCAWIGAYTLTLYLVSLILCFRMGRSPMAAVLAYPVAAATVTWLLWTTAQELIHRVPVKWAGREYVREAR